MPRLFHSPVGVYGAVFAILIWIMNLIGIVGFQGDDEVSLSISVGLMLIFSIYYHTYAKTRQTFSEEEEKIMLVVHVANTGTSKKGSMTEADKLVVFIKTIAFHKIHSKDGRATSFFGVGGWLTLR
ncbi:unnamed protein product [Aphanomyces euteiches]